MAIVESILKFFVGSRNDRVIKSLEPIAQKVMDLFPETNKLSAEELIGKTAEFKQRLHDGVKLDDLLVEVFACGREASWRALGAKRTVKDSNTGEDIPYKAHFPVQIMGAYVLHTGEVAEMVTGEGKTFVATLAAYLNALQGRGVHVITVNDYLARRDAEEQGRVLGLLGMSCGYIQSDMDNDERRTMYACDVTYGTNNEFGFDYLRDNMKSNPRHQVQRDLHYAIIDEVDSILIDEARTPLIISGAPEGTADLYARANEIAKTLKGGDAVKVKELLEDKHGKNALIQDKSLYINAINEYDFELKEKEHQCALNEKGIKKAEEALGIKNMYDGAHMQWPHLIEQALRARNCFHLEKEYVVHDNDDGEGEQVVIVDEFTGRMQHGRRWSDGLHQAVEAKHGLSPKAESFTLATITLQNYFKLYKKLSGMTGTAMTEAAELAKIYKLDVVAMPTNRKLIRLRDEDLIYGSKDEKWTAITERIAEIHKEGRPILVGTASVESSEYMHKLLKEAGLKHNILNAKYHEREADIIAQAGTRGAITVATNMAGRGTDILLGGNPKYMGLMDVKKDGFEVEGCLPEHLRAMPSHAVPREAILQAEIEYDIKIDEAAKKYQSDCQSEHDEIVKLGGLCVVGTERHESRRIDNQLRGRCGRQGDPGSSQFFLSLEDDLMRLFAGEKMRFIMQKLGLKDGQPIQAKMVSGSVERAQKKVEQRNFDIRKNLIEYDDVNNGQRKVIYQIRQNVLSGMSRGDYLELEDKVRKHVRDRITEVDKIDQVTDKTKYSARLANELSHWIDEEYDAEIPEDALRDISVQEAVMRLSQTIRGRIHADKLREAILNRIENVASVLMEKHIKQEEVERSELWNTDGIAEEYSRAFNTEVDPNDFPEGGGGESQYGALRDHLVDIGKKLYEGREKKICSDQEGNLMQTAGGKPAYGRMRQVEQWLLLQSIDENWKQHLRNLDVIKGSIHWEGYAQKDPKDAYKKKGAAVFEEMLDEVDLEVINTLFRIDIKVEEEAPKPAPTKVIMADKPAVQSSGTSGMESTKKQQATRREMDRAAMPNSVDTGQKKRKKLPGANEPCWCGSGKKYKKCHMTEDKAEV